MTVLPASSPFWLWPEILSPEALPPEASYCLYNPSAAAGPSRHLNAQEFRSSRRIADPSTRTIQAASFHCNILLFAIYAPAAFTLKSSIQWYFYWIPKTCHHWSSFWIFVDAIDIARTDEFERGKHRDSGHPGTVATVQPSEAFKYFIFVGSFHDRHGDIEHADFPSSQCPL